MACSMNIDKLLGNFARQSLGAVAVCRMTDASDTPRFVFINNAFAELFETSCAGLQDAGFDTLLSAQACRSFLAELAANVERGLSDFELELLFRRSDKDEFWAHAICSVTKRPDGAESFLCLNVRDIDKLKQREAQAVKIVRNYESLVAEHERIHQELAETQTRLSSAMDAHPDPFVIYDKDMRLVTCNTAYRRSMADSETRVRPGMHVRDVLLIAIECGLMTPGGVDPDTYIDQILERDGQGQTVEDLEFKGDIHQRVLRSFAENGDRLVLRMDITELVRGRREIEDYARRLEEANDAILQKALQDDLTGLGNRRFLSERLADLVDKRRTFGFELAALHIDLDRFKHINDTMGHAAGDYVIRDAAARIQDKLLANEIVARIGGDEFVALVPCDRDGSRAEALARDLVRELSNPSFFEGRECRFGASVGVARTPLSDEEGLLTNSDVALYKAKRRGRGQVAVFSREDYLEMQSNKQLSDDIQRAIECGEFVPFYQPQVDAATGRVVGMEALARWSHPDKGILAPDVFLSVAEDINVLAKIDQMVFENAVAECGAAFREWSEPPNLSFNASMNRITADSIDGIAETVSKYPGTIAFELVETIYLEEQNDAFMMNLDALRDLGVSFEVDDFGSGRASVVALQRIAPDRLKIDRRLVEPVARHEGARRLVQSIVDIGASLDIGVTAEGVESAEHAEILAMVGCDRLQGFHFYRPSPLEDLFAEIEASRSATIEDPASAIGGKRSG